MIRRLISILCFLSFAATTFSQNRAKVDSFQNPILTGFFPDPSICRVGEDYYMVNSSFEWWPGIPIHHSKDLVNWKQIGYVLNRPSQLTFKDNMKWSAGIWAPTIRYFKGTYYVTVTCKQCKNNCDCGDNFMVTSSTPYGPWSEPIWIDKSWGIDPSLFFDDDGKTWYVGGGAVNDSVFGKRLYPNQHTIYLVQINLLTGKSLSAPVVLTKGYAIDAKFAESPHIYKHDGKYILLIAEGGTWHNHAVTGFMSDSITGPYLPFQQNPVLSHRQLGQKSDISTVGHADLIQTQNGEWWAVALGVRDSSGYNQLGRETFLTRVEWDGNVPVFNPGVGRILMKDRRPNLPWTPSDPRSVRDNFDSDSLQLQWNFLRTPLTKWYSLNTKKGWLTLQLRPETVKQWTNPSLIARRIQHFQYSVRSKLSFSTNASYESAGLVLMQNDSSQYRLEKTAGKVMLFRMSRKEGEIKVTERRYNNNEIIMGYTATGLDIQFYIGETERTLRPFGPKQDARVISQNWSGGFIGPFVGMYASSNGHSSDATAAFDWFEYKDVKKTGGKSVQYSQRIEQRRQTAL